MAKKWRTLVSGTSGTAFRKVSHLRSVGRPGQFLAPLCHLAAELFKCRLVRLVRRRRRRRFGAAAYPGH